MKLLVTMILGLLGTFALADHDLPEALGNVSGIVVSPFLENARFELSWGSLGHCQKDDGNPRFYECATQGAKVTLFASSGNASTIEFQKCFVMESDDTQAPLHQYVFNGVYTQKSQGTSFSTNGQLILSFQPNSPLEVTGKFNLSDFDVSYALAGKREPADATTHWLP